MSDRLRILEVIRLVRDYTRETINQILPLRIVVDEKGVYWRDFGDYWSLCPHSSPPEGTHVVAEFISTEERDSLNARLELALNQIGKLIGERDKLQENCLIALRLHDEERESLETLRAAWNAHMETCPQHAALPDLPAPSLEDLQAWRDAPSGTAGATLPGGPDGPFPVDERFPKGARIVPARVETKPGETKVTVDFRGCARPMSVERDGAVNAKDNPPTTDDGGGDPDLTDRQPASGYTPNAEALSNHPFGSDRSLRGIGPDNEGEKP